MLIWFFAALILQLIALGFTLRLFFGDRTEHVGSIVLLLEVILTALTILSILVFYALFISFKNESGRGQNGHTYQQRFVPTTEKVELHLENC